jgi:hypothetical protein
MISKDAKDKSATRTTRIRAQPMLLTRRNARLDSRQRSTRLALFDFKGNCAQL